MTICSKCKREFRKEEMPNTTRGNGKKRKRCWCKDCYNQYMREYRRRLKDSDPKKYEYIQWRDNLRSKYGIEPEEYELMLKSQSGRCKLCGGESSGKGRLHVDHCHDTGVIRGLLCHHCNTGLGAFKHDVELLSEAMIYLNGITK